MNFAPNPTILKGTPTTAEQFNTLIGVTRENYENTFNLNNEAFSGNQYSPLPSTGQVLFEFENDSTTGRRKFKKVVVDGCYISLGEVGTDEATGGKTSKVIEIEATEWTRDELTTALGQDFAKSIQLCVYEDEDGNYGYAFPAIEESELMNKVKKLWLHSYIYIRLSNSQDPLDTDFAFVHFDNQYYMFMGGGESKAEPYGVFRWEGNTGTTGEGEHKQATGTISQCNFFFGRKPVHLDDFTGMTDGTYYIAVPHDHPEEAVIDQLGGQSSLDQTILPLFTIANQKVTTDWRGAFTIPVWEHIAQ